jgi:glutathione S-transferase
MKLYYSRNLNPRVCVAAARHIEAPVEYATAHTFDPKLRDFFHPLNPNLLLPILVEDDGTSLWETDAIVCRLSRIVGSDFFPEGPELPELLRWLSWAAYHWVRAAGALYFDRIIVPRYGLHHVPAEQLVNEEDAFHRCARVLDEVLSRRRWLIGDRLTYADFRVGTALPFADDARLPLADYPHIRRYSAELDRLTAWRDPFDGLADHPS